MIKTRFIPCLLLKNKGLVKTVQFKNPKYVGDPINAVRIFNEKEVHELLFLDITATVENRKPDFDYIAQISDECYMPLAYGGGLKTMDDIKQAFKAGAEKISLNSAAVTHPELIREAANSFGSQSVVVCIDARKKIFGGYDSYIYQGTKAAHIDPVTLAKKSEQMGAGEILINSINNDGTMNGYDLELIKSVTKSISIPVIACGGAGKLQHFTEAVKIGGASAVAAGSFFVFHGPKRAVLIQFPTKEEIADIVF